MGNEPTTPQDFVVDVDDETYDINDTLGPGLILPEAAKVIREAVTVAETTPPTPRMLRLSEGLALCAYATWSGQPTCTVTAKPDDYAATLMVNTAALMSRTTSLTNDKTDYKVEVTTGGTQESIYSLPAALSFRPRLHRLALAMNGTPLEAIAEMLDRNAPGYGYWRQSCAGVTCKPARPAGASNAVPVQAGYDQRQNRIQQSR